jgi:hypothetical protein
MPTGRTSASATLAANAPATGGIDSLQGVHAPI